MTPDRLSIDGAVSVVTGGASGIGKGISKALLRRGARVVIADVEEPVLEQAVGELSPLGPVEGVRTDVSDENSVAVLADHVFSTHGRCNLLFCNAGVTSGGGGKPWQQEPNDWRWCFGVNVFGVAICTWAFVPRMIASGEPGQVIVTSSGDGGFAPVPTASVYASSKAAASCFTEALNHNLISEGTNLRASVFYPSGGLMNTGLFNAQRNRPEHLQRVGEGTGRGSLTFEANSSRWSRRCEVPSPRWPISTSSASSCSTASRSAATSLPGTSTTPRSCCTSGPRPSAVPRCPAATTLPPEPSSLRSAHSKEATRVWGAGDAVPW